jgi:hypothetical protein
VTTHIGPTVLNDRLYSIEGGHLKQLTMALAAFRHTPRRARTIGASHKTAVLHFNV